MHNIRAHDLILFPLFTFDKYMMSISALGMKWGFVQIMIKYWSGREKDTYSVSLKFQSKN